MRSTLGIAKHVARKRGKALALGCELYSSKTCPRCSWMDANLGSAKVFRCEHCDREVPRDVNPAAAIAAQNEGYGMYQIVF
jgi:putative transposase